MPTFEVFLSFFCFIFYVCKNYTSITDYEKSFSLYTYIPIHDKLFLYTHALKTLCLYINTVYIKTLFLFKDFIFLFQHTLVVLYKKFLYIHSLLIHKNFFSHIIYTHTRSSHTLFTYKKTLFLSLYIDSTFVHHASFFFYSWCHHDFSLFYF